ncbi:MAG: tape measure protein [Planctomycetaceae bacterium]|nr:tape measure protein [Planctomycetaceae bacterium]
MSSVGTIDIGMRTHYKQLSSGLNNASKSLQGFKSVNTSVSVGIAKAHDGIITSFAKIGLAVEAAKMMFNTIKSAVATPLTLAAEAEQTAVSFRVLTGSAEVAEKTLADLREFGATTPFDFANDIAPSAKKLLAFGINANEVTGELRRLGDISAGLAIPLGDLSDMYGKARVSGRLFGEDLNQWAGRGVPLQAELAKQFGVTEEKVKDLVSSGKVNFTHLQAAIQSLTNEGGKFGGLMAAQSNTLGGAWSNLQDNVTNALTEIGLGLSDTFNLTWVTSEIGNLVDSVVPILKGWLSSFKDVMTGFTPVALETITILQNYWATFTTNFGGYISQGIAYLGSFLPSFTTFRDSILTGLIAVEFAYNNWMSASELAMTSVALGLVQLGSQIAYQFTTVIPAYLDYLAKNWFSIWKEIGRVGMLQIGNLANNIVSIFENLPSLISGRMSFKDVWTPMTDEMTLQFAKMEKIPDRVASQMEQTLKHRVGQMGANLQGSFDEFKNQRLSELIPAQTIIAEDLGSAVTEQITDGIKKAASAAQDIKLADIATYGSQAARSSIIRHQLGNQPKTLEDINAKQLTVQKQLLSEFKKQKAVEVSI